MTDRTNGKALAILRSGDGYAVEGRGFYAWDSDLKRLIRALREIQRGKLPPKPTQRMLIVAPHAASLSTADPEAPDA